MSSINSVPSSGDGNNSPPQFNAQPQTGLAEILQICCLARRNGQIAFKSHQSLGYILVQQGQVLHAVCGKLEGEDAIYQMLSWAPGTYQFTDDVMAPQRTIASSWEWLLMEGARQSDEGIIAPQEPVETVAPADSQGDFIQKKQQKLHIQIPDTESFSYDLVAEFTYLGRLEENDICIPLGSVSSRHCMFVLTGSEVVVRDLNSSNGTLLNGLNITDALLTSGDILHIGTIEIRYELASVITKTTTLAAPALPTSPQETVRGLEGLKNLRGSLQNLAKTPENPVTDTLKLPRPKKQISEADAQAARTAAEALAKLSSSRNKVQPKAAEAEAAKPKPTYSPPSGAISFNTLAPSQPPSKKSSLGLIIGVIVAVLVLVGAGAYYFLYLMPH